MLASYLSAPNRNGALTVEFKSRHAIYLQIASHICEKILRKEWFEGEKIASIRELALEITVNPNTVARACDYLEKQGIIHTKRGIGYFVSPEANKQIIDLKKTRFLQEDVLLFFKTIQLLQIDFVELEELYNKFNEVKNEK